MELQLCPGGISAEVTKHVRPATSVPNTEETCAPTGGGRRELRERGRIGLEPAVVTNPSSPALRPPVSKRNQNISC